MPDKQDELKNSDMSVPGSKTNRSPSEQLRVRHGKLTEKTVCELLFFAFTTGMDGTLTCSRKGSTKTLRFKAGKLLEARSNDPHDSSTWILYEMGKMDEGFQIDAKIAKNQAGKTMQILAEQIQKGLMQPNEIDEFIHRRVRRILHDLMSWRDGDYILELSKIPKTEPPLKVLRSIPEMIMREVKTAPDPVGLRELMENPATLIHPLVQESGFRPVVKLTAIERRILRTVRKIVSVRDIALSEGLGLEATSRILIGLHAVSLIRAAFPKKSKTALKVERVDAQSAPKPSVDPAVPKKPPTKPEIMNTSADESDDVDQFTSDELDLTDDVWKTEVNSLAQAEKFLTDILHIGFKWDPYIILGIEPHEHLEVIDQRYHTLIKKILTFKSYGSSEISSLLTSVLALLEESRLILLNVTLRKRFESIYSTVDVSKKLKLSAIEHKKAVQAFKDKRLPLAIIHLKFSTFLEPTNSDYAYKLIYMMAQNRRLWAMARLFQRHCVDTFGTNPHIIALSGLLYQRRGDKVKARMEYTRALKMNPELELAKQGMSILDRSY